MAKYDNLSSANTLAQHATSERDQLLVHLFTEMSQKISYLEQEISQWRNNAEATSKLLAELRDKDGDQLLPFADRVLAVIEDSSYTAFTHIEAEIEEKLEGFLESHSFAEAVANETKGALGSTVEEILEELLPDAITDHLGDAEDIVRKGLRSIL